MDAVRLNIGGGEVPLPGYVTIDRRIGTEAYPLGYDDESVDEIRASHVLEHFAFGEIPEVVKDWVRTLKPGGVMQLAVPDFEFIANAYRGRTEYASRLFRYAMGGQTDENDFHRSLFDRPCLTKLMRDSGLRRIRPWRSTVQDCASLPVSLNLQGNKASEKTQVTIPKMICCMSTSKLGFTENMFTALRIFTERQIDIIKHTGAFWGQCLERTMEEAIELGAAWIVTLDYDTIFTGDQFDELCYLMATNTDADAIAPWQCKRECDDPLVFIADEDGERRTEIPLSEFCEDLYPAKTAHFGCTLLRVEGLKRLPKPWFTHKPNKDNRWGEGRVDEDINFWHKWQEAGNTLFMANHVPIGHLQQVATWPDEAFRPFHQYVSDFQKNGPPAEARR